MVINRRINIGYYYDDVSDSEIRNIRGLHSDAGVADKPKDITDGLHVADVLSKNTCPPPTLK